MLAKPMTAPEATVRLPTLPVFSDIHAMFSGCEYGHDWTTHAAKYLESIKSVKSGASVVSGCAYLTPLLVPSGSERRRIHPTSCHAAGYLLEKVLCRNEGTCTPENAPWKPRSLIRSECHITATEEIHVRMYGGAVRALATNCARYSALQPQH